MRDAWQDQRPSHGGACTRSGNVAITTSEDALEELVRADLAVLHRRAFRLTRDDDAAQDLVQDTLERAYRKLALYQPGTDMQAWLTFIMRNVWISHHRRRAGAPPTVSLDEVEAASTKLYPLHASAATDVEASVVDDLSVAAIRVAIDGLPSRLRQVVVLADVEETPYGSIATALDIPPGTVASRLSRGRRRLQQVLLDQARGAGYLAKAG